MPTTGGTQVKSSDTVTAAADGQVLYAMWQIEGSVSISGTLTYGSTLTSTISDIDISNATLSYQWYSNTTNSTVGGTALSGSTSSNLTLKGTAFDKYIYLVVTITFDNSETATLTSNVTSSKIAKRPITVTAGSSSKVYDGTALTNSTFTVSETLPWSSHSVSATITSSITNVGSVANTFDEVKVVYSDGSDITKYYDITTVNGTLTVTKANISVSKTNYSGLYDGSSHTFTLSTTPSTNRTIYYSTSTALTSSNYSSKGSTTKPTRTEVGTTTVYYYVHDTSGNYNDYASNAKGNNASIVILEASTTVTYNANGGTFGSTTTNVVNYKFEPGTVTATSKTSNVSADGTTADTNTGYGNSVTTTDVITIPGASELTVTITYQTESTSYDWIYIYDGNDNLKSDKLRWYK